MDLLMAAAMELPCGACGGSYTVTLAQLLTSQETLLHEGCSQPDRSTECPPAAFARWVDHNILVELQQNWQRLEEQIHAAGGQLTYERLQA